MAETSDHRVALAYSYEWLENGFAISSFSLPVEQRIFVPSASAFSGLWGAFADSLPNAWGWLLVNRMLQSQGFHRRTYRSWSAWRLSEIGYGRTDLSPCMDCIPRGGAL